VERAEAEHQIHRVDADHGPVPDQPRQDAEGAAIFGVVEGRHQNRSIREIEVRVAGRQAATADPAYAAESQAALGLPLPFKGRS